MDSRRMYGFMQRSCVAYMALVVHSGAFWFKLIELLRTVIATVLIG